MSANPGAAATLPRNSVGSDVKDGSVSAKDFGGGLPAGPVGPQGALGRRRAPGRPGPPGISEYERVQAVTNLTPGATVVIVTAACPAGKVG